MTWQDIVMSFFVAAAFYAGWKGVSVLVARELRGSRKLLRYIWPTAMLAWSWLMLLATSFPSYSRWMGKGLDVALAIFYVLNLPAVFIGNAVLVILIDWPDWAKGLAASAAVWLVWYCIIRAWEWWRARNAPVNLSLGE